MFFSSTQVQRSHPASLARSTAIASGIARSQRCPVAGWAFFLLFWAESVASFTFFVFGPRLFCGLSFFLGRACCGLFFFWPRLLLVLSFHFEAIFLFLDILFCIQHMRHFLKIVTFFTHFLFFLFFSWIHKMPDRIATSLNIVKKGMSRLHLVNGSPVACQASTHN